MRELLGGTRRFGELRAGLPGVSPETLTDRLRTLDECCHGGVVEGGLGGRVEVGGA